MDSFWCHQVFNVIWCIINIVAAFASRPWNGVHRNLTRISTNFLKQNQKIFWRFQEGPRNVVPKDECHASVYKPHNNWSNQYSDIHFLSISNCQMSSANLISNFLGFLADPITEEGKMATYNVCEGFPCGVSKDTQ